MCQPQKFTPPSQDPQNSYSLLRTTNKFYQPLKLPINNARNMIRCIAWDKTFINNALHLETLTLLKLLILSSKNEWKNFTFVLLPYKLINLEKCVILTLYFNISGTEKQKRLNTVFIIFEISSIFLVLLGADDCTFKYCPSVAGPKIKQQ